MKAKVALATALVLGAAVLTAFSQPARKPVTLLVHAADLGWRDVGYQSDGRFLTPKTDRLAREGLVFSAAYAGGANCEPSRACLMSGQYTPRQDVYSVSKTDRSLKELQRLVPITAGTGSETRSIAGWTLHISQRLLAQDPEATARAVELLEKQLLEIVRVVPTNAVVELRQVPLYFSPEYPGQRPRAEYHPNAGWLREHGRDPAMAKGVEFTNIRIFAPEMNRMPNFALHELAHAYHDRFLPQGFANPEIKAAYEQAKAGGKYDRVERWHGSGKPNTFERAYALTNPQEFFAENSEAFFGRNDYFPFTRAELKQYDPETFGLLAKLWKTER